MDQGAHTCVEKQTGCDIDRYQKSNFMESLYILPLNKNSIVNQSVYIFAKVMRYGIYRVTIKSKQRYKFALSQKLAPGWVPWIAPTNFSLFSPSQPKLINRCGDHGECEAVGSSDYTCDCEDHYEFDQHAGTCLPVHSHCEWVIILFAESVVWTLIAILRNHFNFIIFARLVRKYSSVRFKTKSGLKVLLHHCFISWVV